MDDQKSYLKAISNLDQEWSRGKVWLNECIECGPKNLSKFIDIIFDNQNEQVVRDLPDEYIATIKALARLSLGELVIRIKKDNEDEQK